MSVIITLPPIPMPKIPGPEIHLLLLIIWQILQLKCRNNFRELLRLILKKPFLQILTTTITPTTILPIPKPTIILRPILQIIIIIINGVDHGREPIIERRFLRVFLEFDAAVLILVFRKVIDRRAHLIYSLALWPCITFIMRVPPNLLLPPTNPPDLQLKLPNHPFKFSPLIPLTSQLVIHVLHSLEHAVLDLFEFFVFLFVFS